MLIDSSLLDQVHTTLSMDSLDHDIKRYSNEDLDKFKFVNVFLYFEECLYIPNVSPCLKVLQACYDFPTAIHFGFNKMLEFILEILSSLKYGKLSKTLCSLVTH